MSHNGKGRLGNNRFAPYLEISTPDIVGAHLIPIAALSGIIKRPQIEKMNRTQHDIKPVEFIGGKRTILALPEPVEFTSHQHFHVRVLRTLRQNALKVLWQPICVHGNKVTRVNLWCKRVVLGNGDIRNSHPMGTGDKLLDGRMTVIRHISVGVLSY
jgi:hypothetical protein